MTAIILSELIKLAVSALLVVREAKVLPISPFSNSRSQPQDLGTLTSNHHDAAIPAGLYTLATFLQSLGAYNLDFLPYLMLSQIKLIITPVFGVMFLQQKFTRGQWVCFFMIGVGIVLVQTASVNPPQVSTPTSMEPPRQILGVAYMLLSGICVALAGIRTERMLQTPNAFLSRNAHLAAYSVLFASLVYIWRAKTGIANFFHGYSPLVWGLILLQATGGFLVAWSVALTSTVTKNSAQVLGFLLASMMPLLMQRSINPQVGLYIYPSVGADLFQHFCGVMLAAGAVFGSVRLAPNVNRAIIKHAAEKGVAIV